MKTNNVIERFLFNLTLILIFFKLLPNTQVNDWSWWAVLAPVWIPLSVLPIAFVVSIVYTIVMGIKHVDGLGKTDYNTIRWTSYALAAMIGAVVVFNWR